MIYDRVGMCAFFAKCFKKAIFGGNSNNGSNCGAFYLNVNNLASNANWNIGVSLSSFIPTPRWTS